MAEQPSSAYPTGATVPFPYPSGPYPQQEALMDTILKSLRARDEELALADKDGDDAGPARVILAESPTGTGKVST